MGMGGSPAPGTGGGGGDGGPVAAADITDASSIGRNVLTSLSQAAARTAIGAGTSNFNGDYDGLTGQPELGSAAAANTEDFEPAGAVATEASARTAAIAAEASARTSAIAAEATARNGAIDAAVAQLLGGSPTALDTLNELAAAIGNDANYAATVTAALAGKVGTGRQVIAGTGLTGGGTLAADRTLAVAYGTTAGTAAQGNDSRFAAAAQKASNLSDLASASTARTNLGLGGAAVLSVGTTAGTVAAGNDSRFAAAVQKTGDEAVAGIKTFTSSPIVPLPVTDNQAARKDYVDDAIDTAVPPGTHTVYVMDPDLYDDSNLAAALAAAPDSAVVVAVKVAD